jgi:hypothetical protein
MLRSCPRTLSRPNFRDKLGVMHASQKPVPLAKLSPVWPPPRDAYPWEIGRGWLWLGALGIILLIHYSVPAFFNWPHVISSSGGRYFVHPTIIPVAPLQQNDPLWGDQLLGNTIETVGQAGCAITSAAMVLRTYGVDTDPQRLNTYLTTHGGYVGDGLLVWEAAAELGGGQVRKAYEDLPSYALIDGQILKHNPVIVRVHLRNGTTHFVVIVGKQGWNYLIRDPARPPEYGVYPLRDLVPRIEALRFYTIVPPPGPLAVKPALLPTHATSLNPTPATSAPAVTLPIAPPSSTPLTHAVPTPSITPTLIQPSAAPASARTNAAPIPVAPIKPATP